MYYILDYRPDSTILLHHISLFKNVCTIKLVNGQSFTVVSVAAYSISTQPCSSAVRMLLGEAFVGYMSVFKLPVIGCLGAH